MHSIPQPTKRTPDLVVAHDYLIQMGGAERVVASMLRRQPDVPVYTSAVRKQGLLPEFEGADLRVSWMQRLPRITTCFKRYFALYPQAFRSFGVVSAGAAWVSASAFAKCMRFSPDTATVLYCHSPTRFLWDCDTYLRSEIQSKLRRGVVRSMVPALRGIDRKAAGRFDVVVANSHAVRHRIWANYQVKAEVIHPPVDLKRFTTSSEPTGDYHLVLSRLVGYKAIDRAVLAFTAMNKRLVVIGEGPDRPRLQKMAGPSVEFLGNLSDEEVNRWVARCRSLIFPGEEDFGIAPVEVQAAGRPVVAFGKGGALETVIDGETGCFFYDLAPEALIEAVRKCESIKWEPERIRRNAERFSDDEFHRKTSCLISDVMGCKAASCSVQRQITSPVLSGAKLGAYSSRHDLA
jgi:glycosyltransferase involved in cell wall biosynthesis